MPGNGNQYVDVTAPTVPGLAPKGILAVGHDDVGNMSFKKWSMSGGAARAMVHNETSAQRTATVTVTFLYL